MRVWDSAAAEATARERQANWVKLHQGVAPAEGRVESVNITEYDELTWLLRWHRERWLSRQEQRKMEYRQAGAILAAGYRRSRTITTQAELDMLPIGSVIKRGGKESPLIAIKHWESKHPRKDGTPLSEWLATGHVDPIDTGDIGLPAVVLWEPEA